MPQLVIVCDTNCYRKAPPSEWESVRDEEARAGVLPIVNFWTAMELAAHMLDEDEKSVEQCHRALRSLWTHCRIPRGDQEDLPFAGDSESQLALTLFDARPVGRDQEASLCGFAIRSLAKNDIAAAMSEVRDIVIALRQHRDATEADFSADMLKVVSMIDPSASGWLPLGRTEDVEKRRALLEQIRAKKGHPYMAEALVRKAATEAGVHVDDVAVAERVRYVTSAFPTPLFFYDSLLQKMIESGIDFAQGKHANSIWDLQLCFYALPDATIAGARVVLMTDERAIRRAAELAGAAARVITSDDYFSAARENRLAKIGA